ncbi:hypothetical protein HMPREF9137_1520 [Prevotella denticola F0289]|nr:hypothetical protein HMPREF9137_1520 [Prevotella denticola F0289]
MTTSAPAVDECQTVFYPKYILLRQALYQGIMMFVQKAYFQE